MVVMTQDVKILTDEAAETKPSRRKLPTVKHRVGALLILAFAVVVAGGSMGLPFGSIESPSPGFWPLVVSCLTAVFAIVELLTGNEETESFTGQGVRRTLIMVGALLLIPIAYEFLGFLIPTFMMILIMMVVLSKQKLWLAVLVGALVSTSGYYVFAELLQVRLSAF